MKKQLLLGAAIVSSMAAAAQWTIRESDFPGSNLQQIAGEQPYLVHIVPDSTWARSNFAPKRDIEDFMAARYGMFIHFGLATQVNKDLSWEIIGERVMPDKPQPTIYPREEWTSWADSLSLAQFDKHQLAKIIKDSGMKYVVVIAKHHDGFHLWDTKFSDFKSTNTPYGKDFVREVLDAGREAGVKVGIYYSQRDWYHPDYAPLDTTTIVPIDTPPYYRAKDGMTPQLGTSHNKYLEYQYNALRELCTNYGRIDIMWFDAAWWGGMFTPEMWDAEGLTRMIRELQPDIVINNRASLPGDFDTPEQRIGMFQNRRPWESCMTLCDSWSYSPTRVKSPIEIFHNLQSTAIGDGNLLLSWGMKWNGKWDETQQESLKKAGDYLNKYGESIYDTHGGPWLPREWGGSTYRGNKIYLHITSLPVGNKITLPEISGIKISECNVITGQDAQISVQHTDYGYNIDTSNLTDASEPIIISLTANCDIAPDNMESDMPAAANSIKPTFIFELKPQAKNAIDLKGLKNVTRITVTTPGQLGEGISISLSADGQSWDKVTPNSETGNEATFAVTSYKAGALLDGREIRYITVHMPKENMRQAQCNIFTK